MSLNCAEIEEVIKLFPEKGVVKKFYQKNNSTLIIDIQQRDGSTVSIYISVKDGNNIIILLPQTAKIEKKDLKFSQYLNANVIYSKIDKIYQLNFSRIVIIEMINNDKKVNLIIRMWGNGSNILLTDNNYQIIECLRRFPKRGEWIGEKFDINRFPSSENCYKIRNEFKGEINKSIYNYYQEKENNENLELLKKTYLSRINPIVLNIQNKIKIIEKNINEDDQNNYLYFGELLKNNLNMLKDFSDEAIVTDYTTGKKVIIKLNKELTIKDNLNRFFEKYKKIKEGKIFQEEQKELLSLKLTKLNRISDEINRGKDELSLLSLKNDIDILTGKNSKQKKSIVNYGREFILSGGERTYVSKNAKDADQILKRIAKGNDYWFHVRDYAGSHVIVKHTKGKDIDNKSVIEAAHLALHYSQIKNVSEGDVYFTRVKYLHKPNTNTPGLVFPTREKNIKISFKKEIIENILSNIIK